MANKKDEKEVTPEEAAAPKTAEEAKASTPLDDGRNKDAVTNEIGPSGDLQAPVPPGNADSPVEADDESLSDEEKDFAEEVANHPLTKQAEEAQKAAEKEQEAWKKEQEEA